MNFSKTPTMQILLHSLSAQSKKLIMVDEIFNVISDETSFCYKTHNNLNKEQRGDIKTLFTIDVLLDMFLREIINQES